jgi:hypothetical protein
MPRDLLLLKAMIEAAEQAVALWFGALLSMRLPLIACSGTR